jgi:hypothetical protein
MWFCAIVSEFPVNSPIILLIMATTCQFSPYSLELNLSVSMQLY